MGVAMNLRILKKLSKRASPILKMLEGKHFGVLDHYPADTRDGFGYLSTGGFDRKHWDRDESVHRELWRSRDILLEPRSRAGTDRPYIKMTEPSMCWDGTPMVGWSSGYETPEWEERTAWEYLADLVRGHTMDAVYDSAAEDPDHDIQWVQTVRHPNPAAIMRYARGLAKHRSNI